MPRVQAVSVLQRLLSVDAGMGLDLLGGCSVSRTPVSPVLQPQTGTRLLEPRIHIFLSPPCGSHKRAHTHTHVSKGTLEF